MKHYGKLRGLILMLSALAANTPARADGTPVGTPESFSLTINPDATVQDVNVTGMTLVGPGVGGVPSVTEPSQWPLLAIGLAALMAGRWHFGRRNRSSCRPA